MTAKTKARARQIAELAGRIAEAPDTEQRQEAIAAMIMAVRVILGELEEAEKRLREFRLIRDKLRRQKRAEKANTEAG